MSRSISIAAVLLLCISQSALAEGSGVYVGAGVASGDLSACVHNGSGTCSSFTSSSRETVMPRVIVGYDFNRYFGVETGYSPLGTYNIQNAANTTIGSVKSSAITLAAKGGYAFHSGFSVFGRLGLANVRSQYSANPGWIFTGNPNQRSNGLLVGMGGQYNFNQSIGLRLNTEILTYTDDAYVNVQGGVNLFAIIKF